MAGVPVDHAGHARCRRADAEDRRENAVRDGAGRPARGRYRYGSGGVAKAHPEVSIGSYPFFSEAGPNTNIVVRSRDPDKLAVAAAAVREMLEAERVRLAS
jgi:hypothetical protein